MIERGATKVDEYVLAHTLSELDLDGLRDLMRDVQCTTWVSNRKAIDVVDRAFARSGVTGSFNVSTHTRSRERDSAAFRDARDKNVNVARIAGSSRECVRRVGTSGGVEVPTPDEESMVRSAVAHLSDKLPAVEQRGVRACCGPSLTSGRPTGRTHFAMSVRSSCRRRRECRSPSIVVLVDGGAARHTPVVPALASCLRTGARS